MNIPPSLTSKTKARIALEQKALKAVCACLYYDLQDCLSETSDKELEAIINNDYTCPVCSKD